MRERLRVLKHEREELVRAMRCNNSVSQAKLRCLREEMDSELFTLKEIANNVEQEVLHLTGTIRGTCNLYDTTGKDGTCISFILMMTSRFMHGLQTKDCTIPFVRLKMVRIMAQTIERIPKRWDAKQFLPWGKRLCGICKRSWIW